MHIRNFSRCVLFSVGMFLIAICGITSPALAEYPSNWRKGHTFTIVSDFLGCTNSDYYINLANYPIGAGKYPYANIISPLNGSGTVNIVGVDLQMWGFKRYDYVMLGKTQPWGDAISPYLYGSDQVMTGDLSDPWNIPHSHFPSIIPAGIMFPYNSAYGELHLHYKCSTNIAWFQLTVTYTIPGEL